jgi:hypothetical protein
MDDAQKEFALREAADHFALAVYRFLGQDPPTYAILIARPRSRPKASPEWSDGAMSMAFVTRATREKPCMNVRISCVIDEVIDA